MERTEVGRPDSTAPMQRPEVDDPAATAAMEPVEQARPVEQAGSVERPDATRTLPPVDEAAGRWAARAAVPPAGARPVRESSYEYAEELAPDPDDGRSWLTPLVVGAIGLILLGALLTGLWLIFTADDAPPEPTTSVSPPVATSAPPPSRPPATSRPPTSAPPSTAPATTEVPPLIGVSEDEARQRLTDAGLRVEVVRRADATARPGTVLSADPAPGSGVEPNSVVRIVVAIAPQPSTTRSSSA